MNRQNDIDRSRRHAIGWIVIIALTSGLICALAYYADPYGGSKWLPQCWWHAFTGLQCPSCGSTRALHHLMHGDWALAWSCNPFLWCTIALGVAAACLWVWKGEGRWIERLGWTYAFFAIAWGIIRNIWGL